MNVHEIQHIPLTVTTAYLSGAIIGDGHLSKGTKSRNSTSSDYRVFIQVACKDYANVLLAMIKEVIATKATVKVSEIPNRKSLFVVSVRNKSLHFFFTSALGIPAGAKSRVVVVPTRISNASDELKKAFLAGLFDTDGGLRSNRIGFVSASETLRNQVAVLFGEFGFSCFFDSWTIKNQRYYGLRFRTADIDRFLKEIPLRADFKVVAIRDRFTRRCRSGQTGQV